jgi:hypothetical protein
LFTQFHESPTAYLDFKEILPWSLCDTEYSNDTGCFEFQDILNVDSLFNSAMPSEASQLMKQKSAGIRRRGRKEGREMRLTCAWSSSTDFGSKYS